MKKKTILVVDGNLIARKSFYKFKNLTTEVKVKDLPFLSIKLYKQILKEVSPENKENSKEIISDKSGKTINISKTGRIERKIKEFSIREEDVLLSTGTLYGMLKSILSTYEKYNIDKVIICYDPVYKENSTKIQLRKGIIPDYKNRKKDPETEFLFSRSLSLAQSLFYKARVEQVTTELFEADDLLQYYSHKIFKNDKILLLTNDHDLFQLLEPNRVRMLRPGTKFPLFTATDFKNEFLISSKQWRDVLTLGGCSTDNVKGIRGISQNGAVGLIRQYGSIDKLLKTYKLNPPKKRLETALNKEAEQDWKNLKLAYRLVSLYGLKKELEDDISITNSPKTKEIALKQTLISLNLLKFRSFLTNPAKEVLRGLIYQ